MNERRKLDRRISPAIGEFAVQQAPALYAEIDRLKAQLRGTTGGNMNIDELLARLDTGFQIPYAKESAAAIRQLRGSGEPVAWENELARACNLANLSYTDFLRIKAYLPVNPQPAQGGDMTSKEFAGRQSEQSVQAPSGGQPQASASPANLEPVAEFTLENGCLTRTTLHSGLTGEFVVYEKPIHPQQGVVVPEGEEDVTIEMRIAAGDIGDGFNLTGEQICMIYRAMLASRPAQGAQNAEKQT